MFLTDFIYWFFVGIALIVYYIVPLRIRPYVLLSAGLLFYGYYAQKYVWLIGFEMLLVFALSRWLTVRKSRFMFMTGLLVIIGVLGYFKYSGMFVDTFNELLGFFDKPGLLRIEDIVIPWALSYITFELIHYFVEMYKGNLPKHGLQHFLSFSLFFPTLVAGPIKQFQKFMPELTTRFAWHHIVWGTARIIIGLFKKLVLADSLNLLTQTLSSSQTIALADTHMLWIELIAYSFVIYLDFSGYSDIAIGTARLFGIKIPENFNFPYLSRNISEFWNRWHISLGRWLGKYIYIPLGGSRVPQWRICFNLIVTLAVSGLWHGAAWHFVIWGLSHGVMLAVYNVYARQLKPYIHVPKWLSPVTTTIAILTTFSLVVITRVFFILPLSDAWFLLQRLFTFS